MALYAIGDVQGCFQPLLKLLGKLEFDAERDQLWFTGDLVNRGPESLEVLRFVRGLGDAATVVLGNHDLHLLAVSAGAVSLRPKDTLEAVLEAPDRDQLIHWLRMRPFCVYGKDAERLLVHASIYPDWDIITVLKWARELEDVLRGAKWKNYLSRMYGNAPRLMEDAATKWEKYRFATNVFTRVRFLGPAKEINLNHKGPPGEQPRGYAPWFEVKRKTAGIEIVFGHWSTLGKFRGKSVIALDTGCIWGGSLTAVRLDPGPIRFYRQPCRPNQHRG